MSNKSIRDMDTDCCHAEQDMTALLCRPMEYMQSTTVPTMRTRADTAQRGATVFC